MCVPRKYYRNPYPNYLRSKEQRKARYCFLRQSGLNRNLTRCVVGFRDSRIVMFLENYGELQK